MCTQQTKKVSFNLQSRQNAVYHFNWNDDFLTDDYFHKGNYLYISIPMSISNSVYLYI